MEQGDLRALRLAANEAAVRRVNDELIRPDDETWVTGSRAIELVCECADPGCDVKVTTTYRKYALVRQDALMFIVAPGHEIPGIEEVLERTEAFSVVRKLGIDADVAERTDPRA